MHKALLCSSSKVGRCHGHYLVNLHTLNGNIPHKFLPIARSYVSLCVTMDSCMAAISITGQHFRRADVVLDD